MESKSLTQAQTESGIVLVFGDAESTCSTFRHLPYSEIYRQASGVMETPAQRIQRAAADEQSRRRE